MRNEFRAPWGWGGDVWSPLGSRTARGPRRSGLGRRRLVAVGSRTASSLAGTGHGLAGRRHRRANRDDLAGPRTQRPWGGRIVRLPAARLQGVGSGLQDDGTKSIPDAAAPTTMRVRSTRKVRENPARLPARLSKRTGLGPCSFVPSLLIHWDAPSPFNGRLPGDPSPPLAIPPRRLRRPSPRDPAVDLREGCGPGCGSMPIPVPRRAPPLLPPQPTDGTG